jgi:hypothetical protein
MAHLLFLMLALAGSYNVWAAFSGAVFSGSHLLGGVLLLFIPCLVAVMTAFSIRDARYMTKRLLNSPASELTAIYEALGAIGDEQPVIFRLGRTGLTSKDDTPHVPIIGGDALANWAGKQITLGAGSDGLYVGHLEPCQDPQYANLHGEKYALVGVPRITMKNGKSQNRFQYEYYLQKSKNLHELICAAFPNVKPTVVLEFLFETYGKNAGFLGFGGCFIGGYPRWIEEPDFPNCPKCHKRMQHLLEIGSNKAAWNRRVGQSYCFSCKTHPEEFQMVTQWD